MIGLALAGALPVYGDVVKISDRELADLGIVVGALKPVETIPVLTAPAKAVIPPGQEHIVSVSEPGLITSMTAAAGDQVKKGQVLAQLASPDILSMQRLYLKARNELALEALHYRRDRKLLDSGIIPRRRWQETRSQYQISAAEADEYRQALEIAGMSAGAIDELARTRRLSGELTIRAPAAGVVLERMATAGSRVTGVAPLYRIGVPGSLWLEIAAPAELAAGIRPGDQVEYGEAGNRGRVDLIGRNVDAKTQTVPVRAVVDHPPAALRPGQKLNVHIRRPAADTFTVANTAIIWQAGVSYIFIRVPRGFQSAAVDVLARQPEQTIIAGKLTGHETVALQGTAAIKAVWLGLGGQ